MLIKFDIKSTGEYLAEQTGYILIKYNEKEYRRKLSDKVLHNEWRYTFRLNNTLYILPFNLDTGWNYVNPENMYKESAQ